MIYNFGKTAVKIFNPIPYKFIIRDNNKLQKNHIKWRDFWTNLPNIFKVINKNKVRIFCNSLGSFSIEKSKNILQNKQ